MPVLARLFEAAGFSTVLVTMMPYWAEKIGTPRTVGVEFPFSQPFGQVGDSEQQLRVLKLALATLIDAKAPGTVTHLDEIWPIDQKVAYKQWQPAEASPIIAVLAPRIRELMRQNRRK